jgi:hypothetical protein
LKKPRTNAAQALQAPTQLVNNEQVLQEIGTQISSVPGSQIISQTDQVVLQPTGQETVEVIRGPFVAEQDAIVEEVQAIPGYELPEGQVPQGLIESSAAQAQPAYNYPAYNQPYSYQGYSYPGYSYGTGSSSSTFCFSADTIVNLPDGKIKRMDELKVKDWVSTLNDGQVSSKMIAFLINLRLFLPMLIRGFTECQK